MPKTVLALCLLTVMMVLTKIRGKAAIIFSADLTQFTNQSSHLYKVQETYLLNLTWKKFTISWLSSTGGMRVPPELVCPPRRLLSPLEIWSENNRKVSITKEICITIDSPPKNPWKKARFPCCGQNIVIVKYSLPPAYKISFLIVDVKFLPVISPSKNVSSWALRWNINFPSQILIFMLITLLHLLH